MPRNTPRLEPAATARDIRVNLRKYLVIVTALFVVEWGLAAVCRYGLHLGSPYTSPLWPWKERFHDFLDLVPRTLVFPSLGVFTRGDLGLPFQYPSPCIYIFLFLVRCFGNPTAAYLVSAFGVFFAATAAFSFYLRRLKAGAWTQIVVWMTLLLGMPLGFLIDSGNIEHVIWLFTALGIVCFIKGWHYPAAVLLGVGGAFKIYPLIFILLFIPRRRYKAMLLAMLVTVTLYFGAVASFDAPFAAVLHAQKVNGEFMRENQVLQVAEGTIRYEHTLLSVYKQVVYWTYKFTHHLERGPRIEFDRAVPTYTVLAGLGFLGLYFGMIRKLPLMNQFLALTVCMVLLPYISFEYTLVHLYTAFAAVLVFLLQDVASGKVLLPVARLRRMMLCFAVLFSYISALGLYRFGGQIKGLVLIALLVLTLKTPMPSSLFGDVEAAVATR